jgi:hypothetical protein
VAGRGGAVRLPPDRTLPGPALTGHDNSSQTASGGRPSETASRRRPAAGIAAGPTTPESPESGVPLSRRPPGGSTRFGASRRVGFPSESALRSLGTLFPPRRSETPAPPRKAAGFGRIGSPGVILPDGDPADPKRGSLRAARQGPKRPVSTDGPEAVRPRPGNRTAAGELPVPRWHRRRSPAWPRWPPTGWCSRAPCAAARPGAASGCRRAPDCLRSY